MSNIRPSLAVEQTRNAVSRKKLLERLAHEQDAQERDGLLLYGAPCTYQARLTGTGSLAPDAFLHPRCRQPTYRVQGTEYSFLKSVIRQPLKLVQTSLETLSLIKEVFKPSVTDLAAIFGVSRPTIYNWQAGQAIAPQNESRLELLGRAAELLKASGITADARPLKRRLPGGMSMLEKIQSGDDPLEAAKQLIKMLQIEANQRASLVSSLAGRAKTSDSEEIGVPYLDESF